jgi:hypothetical protein
VGVARCDTAERSLFFGITVGTDENGIRDVDSVVLGTGTESGICNLAYEDKLTEALAEIAKLKEELREKDFVVEGLEKDIEAATEKIEVSLQVL